MKKFLTILAVVVLALTMSLTLVACGVSGTYKGAVTTYEFSGSTVKISGKVEGFGLSFSTDAKEYKYKIEKDEDGDKVISMWDKDGKEEDKTQVPFNQGKDDKGSFIEIAGIKYYKQ